MDLRGKKMREVKRCEQQREKRTRLKVPTKMVCLWAPVPTTARFDRMIEEHRAASWHISP